MHHIIFIHSLTLGRLCFQVLMIMDKVATDICVQVFNVYMFSTPLGKYQGVCFMDYIGRLCSVLWDSTKLPSKVAIPFCIPSNE